MKKTAFLLCWIFFPFFACAQQKDLFSVISPKLVRFLSDHRAAFNALKHTQALTNRTFRVFYFYSDDENVPKASHYYEGESNLYIYLRENQTAPDEFLCLFFELKNSENDGRFQKIVDLAKSGEIGRDTFAREIMKTEMQSTIRVRDVLSDFQFTKKDIKESKYYTKFKNCPDNFDEYLEYGRPLAYPRDVFKEYELKYDALKSGK